MALAEQNYLGDGTTSLYTIAFPFISESHIKATVDKVDAAVTVASATTVQFAVPLRRARRSGSTGKHRPGQSWLRSSLDPRSGHRT